MAILGKHCKHYYFQDDPTNSDGVIIACEKAHKADAECVMRGKPSCIDYERGTLISLSEMKAKVLK